MRYLFHLISGFLICARLVTAFSDQGRWDYTFRNNEENAFTVKKSIFAGAKIYVTITCDSPKSNASLHIEWELSQYECYEDFISNASPKLNYKFPLDSPCSGHIILPEIVLQEPNADGKQRTNDKQMKRSDAAAKNAESNAKPLDETVDKTVDKSKGNNLVYTITKDGLYSFQLSTTSRDEFTAHVHIEMLDPNGYLSAIDWPLLPFYGIMCLIYVIFGIIWLVVSFLQWRDLLRVQFWIGGVILLGMLEKAMFYAEYQSVNSNGQSVYGVVLLAEWVSCAKRTLARMLVIIVSLGFGIVKPRLGPILHRVVGIGTLYFLLACVESYLRVVKAKNEQVFVASIPLAILDSTICWWIFTSLVHTTRTLRLRRNTVKLQLYRHFTNTLIFAVCASVLFMMYSIKVHRFTTCLSEWRDLWIDDAFWHILFSMLLAVIMILWRPTNNNQRYAFTPLLDNPEDDDDDDEEDQFVADAYGVTMRGTRSSSPKLNKMASNNEDDDLRWVEENIPTAIADAALPIIDSDDEIISTRFEVSKMQ